MTLPHPPPHNPRLQDTAGVIATLCIGRSVHQKLELLQRLVVGLGYDSLTVFGDCFDEVGARRRLECSNTQTGTEESEMSLKVGDAGRAARWQRWVQLSGRDTRLRRRDGEPPRAC
jgi:hypothetical protein